MPIKWRVCKHWNSDHGIPNQCFPHSNTQPPFLCPQLDVLWHHWIVTFRYSTLRHEAAVLTSVCSPDALSPVPTLGRWLALLFLLPGVLRPRPSHSQLLPVLRASTQMLSPQRCLLWSQNFHIQNLIMLFYLIPRIYYQCLIIVLSVYVVLWFLSVSYLNGSSRILSYGFLDL